MTREDIACCGLNCETCKDRFGRIRERAESLQQALDEAHFREVARVIPFMNAKYRGFTKVMDFFTGEKCPGCRAGGGNPFCGIRKCVRKKGYDSCAECETLCRRFNMLYRIHADNEIQTNIEMIRKSGYASYVDACNRKEKSR
ncbi:MAG: DUF3795 domain-containing protein [Spirochaetota bacterium]